MKHKIAILISAVLFAAGCGGDSLVQPPNTPAQTNPKTPQPNPPACTPVTYPTLRSEVLGAFAAGPNRSGAESLADQMNARKVAGDVVGTQSLAWNLVDYILTKFHAGLTIGTPGAIAGITNDVLCFAGVGSSVSTADNTWAILPSDQPQTVVNAEGFAGISLPANPVQEPTLVSIVRVDESAFLPGQGPLATKLDQYPLYYTFVKSNQGGTDFTQPVVVGVCPSIGIDPVVAARLALGHNDPVNGFEIPPPAPAGFLDCTNAPPLPAPLAVRGLRYMEDLAARFLLPTRLMARMAVGGIGGSVTRFSPFGPVDPVLKAVGGIGGSAIRFAPPSSTGPSVCPPVEGPAGGDIAVPCRPEVQVTTNLGTIFKNVPVTYTVTSGAGSVAVEGANGACASFAGVATPTTDNQGRTRACWTLGSVPGTNTVRGLPGIGGDAIPGVTFDPTAYDFSATANPAVTMAFLSVPTTITAGATLVPPVQVVFLDKNGSLVPAATFPVTVGIINGAFGAPPAGGVAAAPAAAPPTSTTTVNAVNGVASFSNLLVATVGTGVQFTASAPGFPAISSPSFSVTAGAPAVITKLQGDGQTLNVGSPVTPPPSVRVTDQFGNPTPNVGVSFTAVPSAIVTGAAQLTDQNGVATVGGWTILGANNTLIAALTANSAVSTTFTAFGQSANRLVVSCAPGGSGDPITYPFSIAGWDAGIQQVELYLSSNGPASTPATYRIRLDARIGGYDQPVAASTFADVPLSGKSNQWLKTAFTFPTPILASSATRIAFELQVLRNPTGARISYNTGRCSLGHTCRTGSTDDDPSPRGGRGAPEPLCNVTQAQSTQPYPFGIPRRKSVAINVFGF